MRAICICMLIVGSAPIWGQTISAPTTEELQGSLGWVQPVGNSEVKPKIGWRVAFGGNYWLSNHWGACSELSFQRLGLSKELKTAITPASNGRQELFALSLGASWRLRFDGRSGPFAMIGPEVTRRRVVITGVGEDQAVQPPKTIRGGYVLGAGWEWRNGSDIFFVGFQYHNLFTQDRVTSYLPILIGARF
jgi:opacity protein-like surface antigen